MGEGYISNLLLNYCQYIRFNTISTGNQGLFLFFTEDKSIGNQGHPPSHRFPMERYIYI